MEKENTVKNLKDFAKRLMKDSGIKMSEIVLEKDYDERVDYRLKDNDTLPFFLVRTGYGDIEVTVGSERENTRTFRFEANDDEINEEFYEAILPLVKKHINKVRDELEAQIKYNGPDGRVVVREGLMQGEIYMTYFMASGERHTATKYESGSVSIGYMKVPSKKFLEHVITYLMEGKEDAV